MEGEFAEGDAGGAERAAAEAGRISRFRETTREERIEIARQAEHRYGRKVAWGARVGDTERAVHRRFGAGDDAAAAARAGRARHARRRGRGPVALRRAGLGRRLVGQHADDWLAELRSAMAKVDDLRAKGPDGTETA